MSSGVFVLVAVFLWGEVTAQGKEEEKRGDDSCHGPAYYRLKEEAAKREAEDKAREEMMGFVEAIGAKLHEALLAEQTRTYESQEAEWRHCLESKRKPSFLCEAVATGNERKCDSLPGGVESKLLCRQLSVLARAWRAGDTSLCGELGEGEANKLCRFTIAGRFDCAGMGGGAAGAVCRSIAAVSKSGGDLGKNLEGLSEPEKGVVLWLLALSSRNPDWCRVLPTIEKNACLAAMSGKISDCPGERGTDETSDRDLSCRDVIVYQAVHPTAYGTEVVAVVASVYRQAGKCTVIYHPPGRARQVMGEVEVAVSGTWTEVRYLTSARGVGVVTAECDWK